MRQRPAQELLEFAEWFDGFCADGMLTSIPGDISEAQKDELRRRKAEYLANRAMASDWDQAFFDRFIQELEDARPSRASGSPR